MGCTKFTGCFGCKCSSCLLCIIRQRTDLPSIGVEPPKEFSLPSTAPRKFFIERMPAASDQENISACAVNACATALTYIMTLTGYADYTASRMFLYYNTRRYVMRSRNMSADAGCTLRNVCEAVTMFGACEEEQWPYERRLLAVAPPLHLYTNAKMFPACTFKHAPQTLEALVDCLLHDGPVMMGMYVFSNIEAIKNGDSFLPMPGPQDKQLGAHAVLVCGYDLDQQRFLLLNCWGGGWGKAGLFEVPMRFVLSNKFCWDFWVLQLKKKEKI